MRALPRGVGLPGWGVGLRGKMMDCDVVFAKRFKSSRLPIRTVNLAEPITHAQLAHALSEDIIFTSNGLPRSIANFRTEAALHITASRRTGCHPLAPLKTLRSCSTHRRMPSISEKPHLEPKIISHLREPERASTHASRARTVNEISTRQHTAHVHNTRCRQLIFAI